MRVTRIGAAASADAAGHPSKVSTAVVTLAGASTALSDPAVATRVDGFPIAGGREAVRDGPADTGPQARVIRSVHRPYCGSVVHDPYFR